VPAGEVAGMVRVMGLETEIWMPLSADSQSGSGNMRSRLARLFCVAYANGIEVVSCEVDVPEPGEATVTFGSSDAAEAFVSAGQAEYPVVRYIREGREDTGDEEGGATAAVHFPMKDIPRLTEEFANLW
jgi:hypothetical protein